MNFKFDTLALPAGVATWTEPSDDAWPAALLQVEPKSMSGQTVQKPGYWLEAAHAESHRGWHIQTREWKYVFFFLNTQMFKYLFD